MGKESVRVVRDIANFKSPLHLIRSPDESLFKNFNQLTIGDLHGNAVKLLYFLAAYRIVDGWSMNLEKIKSYSLVQQEQVLKNHLEDNWYEEFVNFYDLFSLSIEDADLRRVLKFFKCVIEGLKISKSNSFLLRFLGDMLADRGKLDPLIILILDALTEATIPIEIVASNHDLEFIEAIERNLPFRAQHIASEIHTRINVEHAVFDKQGIIR